MVEFANKDKAYSEIVQIVIDADSKLVLISPYIKLPADFLERLKDKDKQGLQTVVVCRGKDLKNKERKELKQLKHVDLRFDDDLHAKCFYNETSMVITSLNLHEHSQQNNREMGILLRSTDDSQVFKAALTEAEFIVRRAKRDSTIRNIEEPAIKEPSRTRPQSRVSLSGYCIRCGKSIAYNVKTPYCPACYNVWVKYKDPNYEEEFCHQCGTPNELTTMNRPICNSCYRKSRRN